MVGDDVAGARFVQDAVDALGRPSLKSVAAVSIQHRRHRCTDLVELLRAEQVGQDHVAVARHGGEVGVHDRGVDGRAAALGSAIRAGQVAAQVRQR